MANTTMPVEDEELTGAVKTPKPLTTQPAGTPLPIAGAPTPDAGGVPGGVPAPDPGLPLAQPTAAVNTLPVAGAGGGAPAGGGGANPGGVPTVDPMSTADPMAFNVFDPANQAYRDTHSVADQNAAMQPYNFGVAKNDAANNLASVTAAGGLTSSHLDPNTTYADGFMKDLPSDQSYLDSQLAMAGFSPDGKSITPTGVNPNPGSVQPTINGKAPQVMPTGPADYLTGGQHTSDLDTALRNLGAPTSSGPVPGSGGTGPSVNSGTPTGTSTLPGNGSPSAPGTTPRGPTLTPTTVDNALTNSTISPGPATDRFKIAQDQYQAARTASEPGYEADLRTANRDAFGAGRGVSGMLRTSRGNIASDRQNTLAKQESDLLNGASTGSIDDAYRDIGVSQQQQGFQSDQQKTAYNQNYSTQQLADQENEQAFRQALSQLMAGSGGDPTAVLEFLASLNSGQSAANNAANQRLIESGA